MRTLKRTFRKPPAAPLADIDRLIEETEPPPQPKAEDPAWIAAKLLLDHALQAVYKTLAEAGRDGVITLILIQSAEWTVPVHDVW